MTPGLQSGFAPVHVPEDQFRLQSPDLYIPPGDIGMWQGALRDRNDSTYQSVAAAIDAREPVSVELLYSDQVGGQRTISRFGLIPFQNPEGQVNWFATINRHWYLDRAGPRPDEQVARAVDVILREREAAEQAGRAEAAAPAEEAAAAEPEAVAEKVDSDESRAGSHSRRTDPDGGGPDADLPSDVVR